MKLTSLVALVAFATVFTGCETTEGNLEAKRRAAVERHRQTAPLDEANANLRNAQQNVLDRDSNPLRAY